MDNSGIYYRLAYQDETRPQVYAQSRWVMPPAALLGQRLRASIARASKAGVFAPADGARADYTLRLELEEFSQVFDAADKSRAVVRLRAILIRNRGLVAQQSFGIERAAATPNAEGGVRALIAASDEAGNGLIGWLAAHMKK
jgi:cholesterol transport system auxiliary component